MTMNIMTRNKMDDNHTDQQEQNSNDSGSYIVVLLANRKHNWGKFADLSDNPKLIIYKYRCPNMSTYFISQCRFWDNDELLLVMSKSKMYREYKWKLVCNNKCCISVMVYTKIYAKLHAFFFYHHLQWCYIYIYLSVRFNVVILPNKESRPALL